MTDQDLTLAETLSRVPGAIHIPLPMSVNGHAVAILGSVCAPRIGYMVYETHGTGTRTQLAFSVEGRDRPVGFYSVCCLCCIDDVAPIAAWWVESPDTYGRLIGRRELPGQAYLDELEKKGHTTQSAKEWVQRLEAACHEAGITHLLMRKGTSREFEIGVALCEAHRNPYFPFFHSMSQFPGE